MFRRRKGPVCGDFCEASREHGECVLGKLRAHRALFKAGEAEDAAITVKAEVDAKASFDKLRAHRINRTGSYADFDETGCHAPTIEPKCSQTRGE